MSLFARRSMHEQNMASIKVCGDEIQYFESFSSVLWTFQGIWGFVACVLLYGLWTDRIYFVCLLPGTFFVLSDALLLRCGRFLISWHGPPSLGKELHTRTSSATRGLARRKIFGFHWVHRVTISKFDVYENLALCSYDSLIVSGNSKPVILVSTIGTVRISASAISFPPYPYPL